MPRLTPKVDRPTLLRGRLWAPHSEAVAKPSPEPTLLVRHDKTSTRGGPAAGFDPMIAFTRKRVRCGRAWLHAIGEVSVLERGVVPAPSVPIRLAIHGHPATPSRRQPPTPKHPQAVPNVALDAPAASRSQQMSKHDTRCDLAGRSASKAHLFTYPGSWRAAAAETPRSVRPFDRQKRPAAPPPTRDHRTTPTA